MANQQQRRPMTPEQRERAAARRRAKELKHKRAMRKFYTRLTILILLVIALIAAVVFLVRAALGGDEDAASQAAQNTAVSSLAAAPESKPEPVPESESVPAEPAPDPNKPADPELWSLLLANTTHPLPEGFEPELASVGSNSRNGQQYMDKRVAEPLAQMIEAAKADGIELVPRSAYRSTREQTRLFNSMKQDYINQGMSEQEAFAATKKWRNEPRTSEHETGLAVDIVGAADINAGLTGDLESRDWAIWLKENAADYGFILRYPKDKSDITGTSFEPWHYRYVGVEDAQKIMAQGITLEEYLGMTD